VTAEALVHPVTAANKTNPGGSGGPSNWRPRPPPQTAERAKVTCFNCRQVGHKSFECPQQVQPGGQNCSSQFQTLAKAPAPGGQPPRTQQRSTQPPATRGRLNHLTAEDAAATPDVALGESLLTQFWQQFCLIAELSFRISLPNLLKKGHYQLSLDQGLS
jgi:hypothetical protein